MAHKHQHHEAPRPEGASAAAAAATDPVCGMTIDPATAKGGSFTHAGETYYFCSTKCRENFVEEPTRHFKSPTATVESTRGTPAPAAGVTYMCPMHPEVRSNAPGPCPKCGMALEPERPQASTTTEWVCPMHPEIVRDEPGSCPICGMALEPRTGTIDEENPELRDMSRRFWFSVALTVPLLLFAMGDMLPGQPVSRLMSPGTRRTIELALATPICLWSAWPFYDRAVRSVTNRSL